MLTKIADQIRAEGRTEGRTEGRAEGKTEGENAKARDAASRMLDEGLDVELVCRVTGLTKEEVESLRKQ